MPGLRRLGCKSRIRSTGSLFFTCFMAALSAAPQAMRCGPRSAAGGHGTLVRRERAT